MIIFVLVYQRGPVTSLVYHLLFPPPKKKNNLPPSWSRGLRLQAVEKLQIKWLVDALVKSFNCKGDLALQKTEDSLKLFLPLQFKAADHIMHPRAADILQLVHSMIHKSSELPEMLERSSHMLSQNFLGLDCRGFIRIKSMTQFKKLQQACHAKLSVVTFDLEHEGRAAELEKELPGLKDQLEALAAVSPESLTLTHLVGHARVVHQLRIRCANLPQGAESKHSVVRDWGNDIVERGYKILETAIGRGLCCYCEVAGNLNTTLRNFGRTIGVGLCI